MISMDILYDQNFWLMVAQAAGFSLARLFLTYLACLIIGLVVAVWLASLPRLEKIAIPIFDVLQNIPPLAFYPLVAFIFIGLNFIQGAAIFVLLAGMLWPMLFGLIGAAHGIPQDVRDAARIFGARRLKYVRYVLLPAMFPAIVASSMSSWSLGWNLLVVAEWIRYQESYIRLTGLGGLLGQATSGTVIDSSLFAVGIASILLFVLMIHILVWRPLLKKVGKYKFD